ncbi:MAG: O-antigen ligase family protein, partial [Anaerolineales bacterium]|nr:O-antigen ligase family protein [Anaerolineales bacterium]
LSPHHKQIGIIMVMGIQLTMSYMRFSQSHIRRLLILVALAAMIMVPIFVGSRTAWLGFAALALGYLFVYGKRSVGLILVATIIVAGVYFLTEDVVQDPLEDQIQSQLISTIENGGVSALGTGRTNIYTDRIPRAVAEHPWVLLVGSGFQNSATVIRGATAAHNNYLQALLELGFFGFAIYIKLLLTILRNLWSTAEQSDDNQVKVVAQDAWVFFIAVLATMMVGESFWAQYSMFTLSGQILAYVAIASAPLAWPKPPAAESELPERNGRSGYLVPARRR